MSSILTALLSRRGGTYPPGQAGQPDILGIALDLLRKLADPAELNRLLDWMRKEPVITAGFALTLADQLIAQSGAKINLTPLRSVLTFATLFAARNVVTPTGELIAGVGTGLAKLGQSAAKAAK